MNWENKKAIVYRQLLDAVEAAGSSLPEAPAAKDFSPLDPPSSREVLRKALEYVESTYKNRIPQDVKTGERVFLILESCFPGHPVYLLGTLYMLLLAEAEIYVRYDDEDDRPYAAITTHLLEAGCLQPSGLDYCCRSSDCREFMQEKQVERLVILGDTANNSCLVNDAEWAGVSRVNLPSAHLLITDFLQEKEMTPALTRFSNLCGDELIDYEAYRAHNNPNHGVYLGFDVADLFWDARAVVNSHNKLKLQGDLKPAIIFTDRPRDQVMLPAGIEKCYRVVFFEDWDVRAPLYDFTQLLR